MQKTSTDYKKQTWIIQYTISDKANKKLKN